MKKKIQFLIIVIFIIFLPLKVKSNNQLPKCKGDVTKWNNCIGTYKAPTKEVYSGEWRSGTMHGQGQLIIKSGAKYIGQFRMGVIEGMGKLYDENGNLTFKGEFKNSKPTKNGIYYSASSSQSSKAQEPKKSAIVTEPRTNGF
jgi:antitoxin component YwqK of YwqJK toxin-antitoxin module